MLAEHLAAYVFVVKKVKCGCTITVAPITLDVFTTLEDYILDPDYEVDLGAAIARRKLGCEHEEQP